MQLSRKTLQTNLSGTKLKVTPSDHPFKMTKWFWQNIGLQNCPMVNSIVDIVAKTAKVSTAFECSLCKVDCWNSHLIAGSPRKRRQGGNL